VVPIPSEFTIDAAVKYTPVQNKNGVTSFIPSHQTIFDDNPNYDFQNALTKMNIQDNGNPVNKENVW
jgi:antitoxin MazE